MSISQDAPTTQLNIMTTNAGAPIDDMKHSQTVGPRGPTLFQDLELIERLQVQNRERVVERVVHARGVTVKGEFVVTEDLSDLTIAHFLQERGRKTPIAVRFSVVIHGMHHPEFLRDIRGFSVKFYTQEGNYDIVANNWPVFFVRDGIRFPEMIRSLKPNPKTGLQEFWRIYDYMSNYPESITAMMFFFDDIGIPKSYRHINGFSINTFKFVNNQGKETFFRWRFESDLGEQGLTDQEAILQHFSGHTSDLLNSIARDEFPKYHVYVQTMTEDQFPNNFDPLDATKEWPVKDFPKRKVGEFILNELPKSFFTDNELIAFAPGRLVPGIAPSNDKLLQARLFAYLDTQTYRLGINNQMLPINAPICPFRDNHLDGMMHFRTDSASTREINYFPSKIQAQVKEAPPFPHGNAEYIKNAQVVRQEIPAVDEFLQARERWLSFDKERQRRFTDRVALSLSGATIPEDLKAYWLETWAKVDRELQQMVLETLEMLTRGLQNRSEEMQKRYHNLMALKIAFGLTSASTK